jgi:hypothetical protein
MSTSCAIIVYDGCRGEGDWVCMVEGALRGCVATL